MAILDVPAGLVDTLRCADAARRLFTDGAWQRGKALIEEAALWKLLEAGYP